MKSITVRVLKHDGREYRRWIGVIAQREDSFIVLNGEFDSDVTHQILGHIPRGSRTIEYYWLDRWYNVFQFLTDDGATRLWYCNINTPPRIDVGVLTYVDLDIDIVVLPDFSYQVLDLEEFELNAMRYSYTEELKSRARQALDELTALIERREFPFAPPGISKASSLT